MILGVGHLDRLAGEKADPPGNAGCGVEAISDPYPLRSLLVAARRARMPAPDRLGRDAGATNCYQRRVPKVFRTPTVMKRPHGPLVPRSAAPKLVSRAPSRSNRKCWVTRNSNPLFI